MASFVRPALLRRAAAGGGGSAFKPLLVQNGSRIASFQTSSRRNILPPLPQTIQGTINDPVPVMDPSPAHGSYHWSFERLLAAGLVPLTIAPFAAGSLSPVMDAVLCGTLLVHTHLGFQAMIVDYVPSKRLPRTRKALSWSVNLATLLVGVGLYDFETNDVGMTEALGRVWTA